MSVNLLSIFIERFSEGSVYTMCEFKEPRVTTVSECLNHSFTPQFMFAIDDHECRFEMLCLQNLGFRLYDALVLAIPALE